MEIKKCVYCNEGFYKPVNNSKKFWVTRKYCSILCRNKDGIGKPHSDSHKLKISTSMKGKQNSKGCKRSLRYKTKIPI